MKYALIILAVFGIFITALHAQILADPMTQQVVTDLLPHQYAAYASSVAIALMIGFRIWQARQNGKGWADAVSAAFTGTNTPTKAPLILAGFCMLSMTSCAGALAFMASPEGQLVEAAAVTLVKQQAAKGEDAVLRASIDNLSAQIAVYRAKPPATSIPQQILTTAKIDGLKAALTACQQQYKGLTGKDYPDAKNPTSTVTP